MPLAPVNTGTASSIGVVGYAYNGVKFDPGTAGSCSATACTLVGNTGSWNIEALGQSSFNFGVDSSNAHVQPSGEYHYHGMPEGAVTRLARGQAMTLVGYALDGFPVSGRTTNTSRVWPKTTTAHAQRWAGVAAMLIGSVWLVQRVW